MSDAHLDDTTQPASTDNDDASTSTAKTGLGVIGVGAAACAACCAGPILGFLAATGIATAAGAALFGALGLLIAVAGLGIIWLRRRRRASACAAQVSKPVAVPTPALKRP